MKCVYSSHLEVKELLKHESALVDFYKMKEEETGHELQYSTL